MFAVPSPIGNDHAYAGQPCLCIAMNWAPSARSLPAGRSAYPRTAIAVCRCALIGTPSSRRTVEPAPSAATTARAGIPSTSTVPPSWVSALTLCRRTSTPRSRAASTSRASNTLRGTTWLGLAAYAETVAPPGETTDSFVVGL
jgi:hypothetical protein